MTVLDDPIQFFGDEPIQDPYPLYDRMRSEAPVHRIGQSVFYAVCSWDAVVECINRVEDFSSNLTATMVYQADGTVTPFLMGPLDDPSHVLAVATIRHTPRTAKCWFHTCRPNAFATSSPSPPTQLTDCGGRTCTADRSSG